MCVVIIIGVSGEMICIIVICFVVVGCCCLCRVVVNFGYICWWLWCSVIVMLSLWLGCGVCIR